MPLEGSTPRPVPGLDRLLVGSAILFVTVAALFASYNYFAQQGESDGSTVAGYDTHYYLDDMYLNRGDLEATIAELEETVASSPEHPYAWYLLGVLYREAGDIDESIAALKRAVFFVPNYAEAYEELILAYDEKGLPAESAYARGMRAYAQGRYDEAIEELEAASKTSSDLTSAYVGLGLVWEAQSEPAQAAAAYWQALKLEPGNFKAQAGLVRLGELPQAEVSSPGSGP